MTNKKLKDFTNIELHKLRYIENKSVKDIAILYDVPLTTLRRKIKNILLPPPKKITKLSSLTNGILYQLHWIEEKSLTEISKIYGVCHIAIIKHAKKINFIVRDNVTATKLAITGDKNHMKTDKSREMFAGPNNHNWKGGITPLATVLRTCQKYNIWRKACFVRDKTSCQVCSTRDRKIGFNIDHIIPFSDILVKYDIKTLEEALLCEELWDINNGRCLCIPCHKDTPSYGVKNLYKSKLTSNTTDNPQP